MESLKDETERRKLKEELIARSDMITQVSSVATSTGFWLLTIFASSLDPSIFGTRGSGLRVAMRLQR